MNLIRQRTGQPPFARRMGLMSLRWVAISLGLLLCLPAPHTAWGFDDLVLPKVEFTATAVHESGAFLSRETIHYADGKLRIDRGHGFSATILDFKTQTQFFLMANHTYLVTPMDEELFRRYIARTVIMSGARRLKTERIEGLETTKYAFGEDGALDAAGSYWLTKTGVMVRREYDDGVFGHNVHHREFLTHIKFEQQPASLFLIPRNYQLAK